MPHSKNSNYSVNSNISETENQRLYSKDTFTYMVKAHGCYRPREKVLLGDNLYLSLHSFQNEGVRYNAAYARMFCAGRLTPHQSYKPIETVDTEYYQMMFCREASDKYPCYIHCCNTNERVFDFIDGDLLLSEVIYLVNFHAQSHGAHWIDLNLLTCNAPCSNDPLIRSRVLIEQDQYQGPRVSKGPKTHPNTRKCTMLKRPETLAHLPFSNGEKQYYAMVGDRLIEKRTGNIIVVTKANLAEAKVREDWVFLGSIDVGSFVKHYLNGEDQLFVVDDIVPSRDDFLLIHNTMGTPVQRYVHPYEVTHYRIVDMVDPNEWLHYY